MTGLEVLALGYLGVKIATGVAITRYYFGGEVPEVEPSDLAQWLMAQGGTAPLLEVDESTLAEDEEELGLLDKAKAWWDDTPDTPDQAALEEQEAGTEGDQEEPSFFEKVSQKVAYLGSSIGSEKPQVEDANADQDGNNGAIQAESPSLFDRAKNWWNTPTEGEDEGQTEGEADQQQPGQQQQQQPEIEVIPNEGPIQLVDVRTEYEYNSGHIPGALWVSFLPPWSLKSRLRRLGLDPAAVIVPICWTAHRSVMCCKVLQELGFKTKHLRGGMLAWRDDALQLPEVAGSLPEGGDAAVHSEDRNSSAPTSDSGKQTEDADLMSFNNNSSSSSSSSSTASASSSASQEAAKVDGDLISF